MLFCNDTIKCIGNSVLFYLNTYYSSNTFLIAVNENLLYLKIWSPFMKFDFKLKPILKS